MAAAPLAFGGRRFVVPVAAWLRSTFCVVAALVVTNCWHGGGGTRMSGVVMATEGGLIDRRVLIRFSCATAKTCDRSAFTLSIIIFLFVEHV